MEAVVRYLSVCSGIEAASCAWHPLGWEPVAFSEIEPFPSAVLAHRYPDTPNLGDMTKYKEWPDYGIDLLVGGTPCQSFSVAGLRRGLEDPRGNLMLTYGAIAEKFHPRWIVWENVPGVLSSNRGRDFGAFLGMLGLLGYGIAYRVLDAQYFGVAQRRRRVFVVGYLGDWRRAAEVLFEPESLRWNPPPRREAGEDAPAVPGTLAANGGGTNRPAGNCNELDFCIAHTLNAKGGSGRSDGESETLLPIPFDETQITSAANRSRAEPGMPSPCLSKGARPPSIASAAVRRLTPRECERLQGFEDDHTLIPWRGGMAPDGPRYKALGNSMAVPVMRWIGKRIQEVELARP